MSGRQQYDGWQDCLQRERAEVHRLRTLIVNWYAATNNDSPAVAALLYEASSIIEKHGHEA